MSMINWADLQLSIMNVLWQQETATVHEVIEAISGDKTPAYTTVLTVLTTLVKQGYVEHEPKPGTRMFQYRAIVPKQEMCEGLVGEILERLFSGSPVMLVRLLLETYSYNENDIEEMMQELCKMKNLSAGVLL